jgi:hypothetical protein
MRYEPCCEILHIMTLYAAEFAILYHGKSWVLPFTSLAILSVYKYLILIQFLLHSRLIVH